MNQEDKVEGKSQDDEINKIHELIQELSKGIPMLTILVNGNPTAEREVVKCVRCASPILIIEGSGDLADKIHQAWQDKQKYIEDLSKWDAEGSKSPQPVLPFVANRLLADVLVEGALRFFVITDEPEKLERTIDFRFNSETIFAQAQAQRQIYRDDAGRQKTLFQRQQLWILLIGVTITALAAFQAFYQQMRWNVPPLSIGAITVISRSFEAKRLARTYWPTNCKPLRHSGWKITLIMLFSQIPTNLQPDHGWGVY